MPHWLPPLPPAPCCPHSYWLVPDSRQSTRQKVRVNVAPCAVQVISLERRSTVTVWPWHSEVVTDSISGQDVLTFTSCCQWNGYRDKGMSKMKPRTKLVAVHPVHGYAIPPPQDVKVSRRNARERNRVKSVNNGFEILKRHIPSAAPVKKMSKVNINGQ